MPHSSRVAGWLWTIVVGVLPSTASAQTLLFDASVGAGRDAGRAAISVWRQVAQAPLKLRLSVGLRVSAYVAMSSAYQNRGTSGGSLTPVLTIDPGVIGANVAVAAELPMGRGAVGANLDLLGLATGAHWREGALEGKPQAGSLFLYGRADRGALNSEFYGAYAFNPRLAIRAGASHYVTNYTVMDTGVAGRPTERYQRSETVPFAALRIRL